jgi:hypothetical protein
MFNVCKRSWIINMDVIIISHRVWENSASWPLMWIFLHTFHYFIPVFVRLPRKPGTGLAQSVRRWATDWIAGVQFPAGEKDFSLFHSVQTGSAVHLASYPVGTVYFIRRQCGRGVKMTTHLHLVLRLKMMKRNFHSPIRLHGVVFN